MMNLPLRKRRVFLVPALLLASLALGSCTETVTPEYTNTHDRHSASYKPNAPSHFEAHDVTESRRVLTWTDNSLYEAGYRVERTLGAGAPVEVIAVLPPNTASYIDTTILATDTTYLYRISSVAPSGTQSIADSIKVRLPFPPPSDLSMTCLSADMVKLVWKDLWAFDAGWRVERSVDGGAFATIAELPPGTTTFLATGLQSSRTYQFRVRAASRYNASRASNCIAISSVNAQVELLYSRQVSNPYEGVVSLDFSPDGTMLACGCEFNADIFRVGDGAPLITRPHSYNSAVYSVKFSPDGRTLGSGHGGSIWLWNTATWSRITQFYSYATNQVYAVGFTPDSKIVAGVNDFNQFQVWSIPDLKILATYGGAGDYGAFDISPDGKFLAGGRSSLTVYDLLTGAVRDTFPSMPYIRGIAFHPSGRYIACIGGNSYKLQLWNMNDGTLYREMQESRYATRMVFDKTGARLAIAGREDGQVNIWDVESGSVWASLAHPVRTLSVAFSPHNNLIATGDSKGIVRVWGFKGVWKLD